MRLFSSCSTCKITYKSGLTETEINETCIDLTDVWTQTRQGHNPVCHSIRATASAYGRGKHTHLFIVHGVMK